MTSLKIKERKTRLLKLLTEEVKFGKQFMLHHAFQGVNNDLDSKAMTCTESTNQEEVMQLLNMLEREGFVEKVGSSTFCVTGEGYAVFEED